MQVERGDFLAPAAEAAGAQDAGSGSETDAGNCGRGAEAKRGGRKRRGFRDMAKVMERNGHRSRC